MDNPLEAELQVDGAVGDTPAYSSFERFPGNQVGGVDPRGKRIGDSNHNMIQISNRWCIRSSRLMRKTTVRTSLLSRQEHCYTLPVMYLYLRVQAMELRS